MPKHEHKICPRCNNSNECMAGDISKCQCYAVKLDNNDRDIIARNYTDCLCAACMHALKTAYDQAQQEITIKRVRWIAITGTNERALYLRPSTLHLILLPLQKSCTWILTTANW